MGDGRWEVEVGAGRGRREVGGGWRKGWTGGKKAPIFDRGRTKWVPARGTYVQTDKLIASELYSFGKVRMRIYIYIYIRAYI